MTELLIEYPYLLALLIFIARVADIKSVYEGPSFVSRHTFIAKTAKSK